MEQIYHVRKWMPHNPIEVTVPGSKSITNRALMLAAMSDCACTLEGVLFSDDSRAFLSCLQSLGFDINIDEEKRKVVLQGTGGKIPQQNACINVRSAGTAARFLTVLLAFAGGDYEMQSSAQMAKRPMQPLLSILENAGARIEYLGEEGHFPFILHAHNLKFTNIEIDTSLSSQFASALLMAGCLLPDGLSLTMTGSRTGGSYIKMTLAVMEQFGIHFTQIESASGKKTYAIAGGHSFGISHFLIEPDLSGAAYFYSMALLFGIDVLVKNVHLNSLQGDIKYVELLATLGCRLQDSDEGLWLKGSGVTHFNGQTVDMKDFSDQAMTFAAVSIFADTVTEIVNIGHIRFQETDRLSAILNELSRMGIRCEEIPEQEGIRIYPGACKPALIHTYEDHRMAMAFTLVGMKSGGIDIENPACCAKTFENYFDLIDSLYTT
ncbi:MAG: 3-phosphoshikimate 1-carboxyvinyltransferase [Clostridiales bacterium]|nr:3-phosphoshikimate 1-carboxyvinyltransferase [Clostridiales bacterium]